MFSYDDVMAIARANKGEWCVHQCLLVAACNAMERECRRRAAEFRAAIRGRGIAAACNEVRANIFDIGAAEAVARRSVMPGVQGPDDRDDCPQQVFLCRTIDGWILDNMTESSKLAREAAQYDEQQSRFKIHQARSETYMELAVMAADCKNDALIELTNFDAAVLRDQGEPGPFTIH